MCAEGSRCRALSCFGREMQMRALSKTAGLTVLAMPPVFFALLAFVPPVFFALRAFAPLRAFVIQLLSI